MDYTICTREFERDYFWETSHASPALSENARSGFFPAFEGSMTTSRFVALLRRPGSPERVVLCVSVSTDRKDFRHRPIRTMAFLRAEEEKEQNLLVSFFAECLCRPEQETLYNASSPMAKAVESLYQTHSLSEFIQFCETLSPAAVDGKALDGAWFLPRGDMDKRQEIALALSNTLRDPSPFLVVLTDREPEAVLSSLGEMLGKTKTIRILSSETTSPVELETGGPKKKLVGRAGVVAGLCILAAVFIYAVWVVSGGAEGSSGADSPPGPPQVDGDVRGSGPDVRPPDASGPVVPDAPALLDANESASGETPVPEGDSVDSDPSPDAAAETSQAEVSDAMAESETENALEKPVESLPTAEDSMSADAQSESERSE